MTEEQKQQSEHEEPKSDAENSEQDANSDTSDNDSSKQFKEILDGTARIGQSIGEAFKGVAEIFTGRDYVVMVRVNKPSLDKIDELIEAGLFKSRSESAAFLIAQGINTNGELFSKIQDKVSEINRLKEELREMMDFNPDK